MSIPKYISHPTLLLLSAGLVLWLVWTGFPVDEQVRKSLALRTPDLPDPHLVSQIKNINDSGEIEFIGHQESWRVAHPKFEFLSPVQIESLKQVLVGKMLLLPNTKETLLKLPLELYDPQCFMDVIPQGVRCPVRIEE